MNDNIASSMLALVNRRGPGKTVCPSEVARSLDEVAWRDHMDAVRATAAMLVERDKIVVTQRGAVVDPLQATGPIRLGLPESQEDA
jgi:hypothetical protein